jgi:hypothetical protein
MWHKVLTFRCSLRISEEFVGNHKCIENILEGEAGTRAGWIVDEKRGIKLVMLSR